MVELQPKSGVLARIRHGRADLPKTANRIAVYIEEHAEEVIRMSITELAEKVEASEGSVVSLCRRLGISGFQELKISLAGELVEPVRLIQEDLKQGDDYGDVADRVFSAHASSLSETRKLLSPDALTKAVELIRNAERIEVFGIGSSAPVASDLAYRLLQLGHRAHAVIDSHVQAVCATMMDKRATAITVSHSGSTVETILATRLAREAGASTIGITRYGKSPLQRYCEVVLHTVANETRYRPEAMSSRVAQLAIIDTLVSCCALSDPRRSAAKLQRSALVISEKRY